MIETSHIKVKASSDDLMLAVTVIAPQENVRAIVQIVHGMCEHKERYFPFMEYLAQKGYACIIHDQRGHGESVKSERDLGYLYSGGWKAMVDDVMAVGDYARAKFFGSKFILFGHSMGSLVVRSYTKRYDNTIDGLFVCGSPSDSPAKGFAKAIALVDGKLLGWHYRPRLLQKLSFGAYNRPFRKEGFKNAWVCSDRKILEQYHSDPLCRFQFTANGFYNLMGLMQDCYSQKDWIVLRPNIPVRFISGALDPCLTSDSCFEKAVNHMQKAGYNDVTFRLYEGMRHEILNETRHAEVWDDIVSVLDGIVL